MMKKIMTGVIVVAASMMTLAACASSKSRNSRNGDGERVAVTRTLTDLKAYDKIEVDARCRVTYTVSPKRSAVLELSENMTDEYKVNVSGGTLKVGFKDPEYANGNRKIVYRLKLSGPALSKVDVSMGGFMTIASPMDARGKDVKMSVSTGGRIVTDNTISCSNLDVIAETGGRIDIEGVKTSTVKADCETGARIEIEGISAKKVKAVGSTAGRIELEGRAEKADLSADTAASIDARELDCNDVSSSSDTMGRVRR